MRYLELVGTPPPGAPEFVQLILNSPHVTEARLLEWNASNDETLTALYAVEGDADALVDELGETPAVVEFDLTRVDARRSYLLLVGRPAEIPIFQRVLDSITRTGLILVTPVVYREGHVHLRIVGTSSVLQSMVEAIPPAFEIEISEIGTFPDETTAPTSALSERQQAAVAVALELGYYESPREATHADIAARLDCAPNTVTEHLQKAERKLIRAAMRVPGETS